MVRKEEIQKAATKYSDISSDFCTWIESPMIIYYIKEYIEKAFQKGAEYADKTIVDKACEWLRSEAKYYWGSEEDIDEMIADFCESMEE